MDGATAAEERSFEDSAAVAQNALDEQKGDSTGVVTFQHLQKTRTSSRRQLQHGGVRRRLSNSWAQY